MISPNIPPPITPPEELVQQWCYQWAGANTSLATYIAAQAAQWGWEQRGAANEAELQQRADQELEACCEALKKQGWPCKYLRAARRPKAQSLKEQALNDLEQLLDIAKLNGVFNPPNTIRRALEQLND